LRIAYSSRTVGLSIILTVMRHSEEHCESTSL